MLTWLSKIDPNVVVGLVTAIAGYLWHQFASPSAQQKVQDGIATALSLADTVMGQLVAMSPGLSKSQLEADLWTAAKLQLRHIGLDPDKLPPAVTAAAGALVQKWLAQATVASSQATPIKS